MNGEALYKDLCSQSREIATLASIEHLLNWDQETTMPKQGAPLRADQLATMATLVHKKKTGKPFIETLSKLVDLETGKIKIEGLDESQQAALREWRRDTLLATKLPDPFVAKLASLKSQAFNAWKRAREENNFPAFAPFLEQLVEMYLQKADYLGYADHPYDALLDHYAPGETVKRLDPLFDDVRAPVISLLRQMPEPNTSFLSKHYSKEKQVAFGFQLMHTINFDPSRHVFDMAVHPFCTSLHPDDCRMTSRIDEHNPMSHFGSLLHESGHLLYDTALPTDHFGTPLGEFHSIALHESQSRLWETQLGQGLPFWRYFYPKLQETFPENLSSVSLDAFYAAINAPVHTPIRIESDEVAYVLHVILRYEIEKQLFSGTLSVNEIPDVWNQKIKEYFDIEITSDSQGCLQDVHWSEGYFGYFPSYALGSIYAAQFFDGFKKDHPDWENLVEQGECAPLREWLRKNIHQHGRQYSIDELMEQSTGEPVSSAPYLNYLQTKYRGK